MQAALCIFKPDRPMPQSILRLFAAKCCPRRSLHFFFFLLSVMLVISYASAEPQATITEGAIRVPNRGDGTGATPRTRIEAGPSVGDILNNHFFPGLEDFRRGNYRYALEQMNYFVERPQYTSNNPKQSEFMSTAYYVRGSIYLDHADGTGRLALALKDFHAALRWQPENDPALFAIARVFLTMDRRAEAIKALELLLSKNPQDPLAAAAKDMLHKLTSPTN
jgi:tetratricopeptide (TPR) repeat protein